jgi:hypothetical protein
MNEFNSFLDRALGLVVLLAEAEELPPLLLLPVFVFEGAKFWHIFQWTLGFYSSSRYIEMVSIACPQHSCKFKIIFLM